MHKLSLVVYMSEFKKFMAVFISAVVLGTMLTVGALRMFPTVQEQAQRGDLATGNNHFSVVYQGFIPGYSANFPDYYLCINDLKDNPLRMSIRLFIQNQEASAYYFRIEQHSTPPAGWTIYPYNVGLIAIDGTLEFVYSEMYRALPSSIPAGELIETVNLDMKAYVDAGYTSLYSADNFTVTYHMIDRMDPSWTVIEYNNFDDQTNQGWTPGQTTTQYYRSFRYSLYSGSGYFTKTFNVIGYSKAYLICPIRMISTTPTPSILIDGTKYFQSEVSVPLNVWYSYTVPLPVYPNPTPIVRIEGFGGAYMDDVYLIGQ